MYRPFIDDPAHLALLEGQRYVVLRAAGAVRDAYAQVQRTVREKLAGLSVSYPAHPHVTLAGLAQGTAVDAVRELVAEWAPSVAPVHLDVERVNAFPTPFQIAFVQIRKTPELERAMSSLRERAQRHGLTDVARIAPADWVFHMSVAYCSSLSAASWGEVTPWLDGLVAPLAQCVVSEAEIVAFDDGREWGAGVVALNGSASAGDGPVAMTP